MDSKHGTCLHCGCKTTGLSFEIGGKTVQFGAPDVCASPECTAKADAAFAAAEAKRTKRDGISVPVMFQDTDCSRLPSRLGHLAKNWTPHSGKGNLLLHGTTRIGKTRTAWEICKRLDAIGVKVKVLTMRDIEFQLQEGFQKGDWHRVVDRWCGHSFLFIDDLGKEKLTERTASVLFQIVDERSANRRSTMITTNYDGSTLKAKFPDAETGAAFVARLREFYDFSGEAT